MNTSRAIAHAARDANGNWREAHDLADHLRSVADLASQFANRFHSGPWAYLAGMWHDLGKYRPRFQQYIRQASGFDPDAHIAGEAGRTPHSTAGAMLACDRFTTTGRVLAYLIAGHHAGLSDWFGGLDERLEREESRTELKESLSAHPPDDVIDHAGFIPDLRATPGGKDGFALWVRILFSCLVDADFLDTERYMDAGRARQRGDWPDLPHLLDLFNRHMFAKLGDAPRTAVNALRNDVLRQCRVKAHDAPGLFSLTVPTGGGKTLSSMAFALEHARHHHKRRIIYAIPYTSIIEQTADAFRGIFGDALIEHHSNTDADPDRENHKTRLACENWDAPIVVTTNVQFFESLFAARTSRCRKLHNIVDSIVVLDEAQMLPPEFLQPILDILNLLSRHYGVTFVLSTATQPALATRTYFDARNNMRGLEDVREIVHDPDALYAALERVRIHLPGDWDARTGWDELAAKLARQDSVLAIVNRRRDARELWQRMPTGTVRLSALMCGEHRSRTIRRIKAQLKDGVTTRVVSTQLVEAGVDLDFPVVYRALAGLDSIAQAAGRCNREGRLAEQGRLGEVVVFIPPQPAPPGLLRKGEDTCRSLLHGDAGNPLSRSLFTRYFELFYHACDLDAQHITQLLAVDGNTLAVNFRTAADRFRLIPDDDGISVIVRYRGEDARDDTVDRLLASLRSDGPERWLMRKLQRYAVGIPRRQAKVLLEQGDIEELFPGLFVQVSDWLYDSHVGLLPDGRPLGSAGSIV
ncbi:MAG TPA: CRISPR-associated helicase Cas3' [Noviherbaspirillum sp.]|uniref:CRISPR-associated helicase Cas3' n=1 Tax=Noviherbaspirillum sp. TaxID=1926288 RepID=UPI002B45947D|nr:CRISPR-associated helicase Cas3' [Noviherbaspirillum sp.]HJV87360.1 CRISPR-associated helicase Cas3' [Noviherbaspirillum sp.]